MTSRNDFLIGPKERAIEAIRTGKTEEAIEYLNSLDELRHSLHDRYCNTSSFLQGLVAEDRGEEWLEELNRILYEPYRSRFEAWKDISVERRVELVCNIHRTHYSEFNVEEDDKKFVVAITACNAGGRLMRDGIARQQKAITKKAHPWSFNKVGFPYYCVHVSVFNRLWKELGINIEVQWGKQYDDRGKSINEPCKYIVYKY